MTRMMMHNAEPRSFAKDADPCPAPLVSRRILVAEDSPESQRLLSIFLKRAGAEVAVADNGRIALEMMETAIQTRHHFDLLLVDVEMPVMDGHSLTRALRERGCSLPIVAITGHTTDEVRQMSLAAGCDEHATKPVDREFLIGLCRRWINLDRTAAI